MKTGTVSRYVKKTLLLLVLLGFCMRSYAATSGSITLSGAEQFNSSNSMWDAGNVTVSINGYAKTVPYGQYSTPDSIASAIAALFTSDCNGPANARSAPGGVIYVQMRDGAALSQLTVNTYSSISFTAIVNSDLIQTTTTATIALTQLLQGQTTAVSVQVSCDSACGSVDYRIDGGDWGTVALDANGHFSASTSSGLASGLHNVVINYQGNGTYAMSTSNPVSFMISSSSTPTNPTTIYSYNITGYQANGNVSAYTDAVNGSWSNIQYDGVNRLTEATQTVSGNTQYLCWSYDSFGDRTAQVISGSQCSAPPPAVNYNANNQNTALQYDASGDVTNDRTNQYLYDAEGRVCAVQYQVLTGGPLSMMGYIYDAEGRRVAKGTISSWSCDPTSNGFQETAGYVLGPSGEQLTEVDGGANWVHTNVYAAGNLIATYDPDGLHFYLSDWLGTRHVDTDYAGNPESNYHSLPFGELVPSNQTISNTEHFFTGKERDTESGLDYFGARYYASAMGRFSSPDPSGLMYADRENPQSFNLYSYVGNNPLKFIDPLGYYSCDPDTSSTSTDSEGNTSVTVTAGKCHFDASDFYQAHLNQMIARQPSPPPLKLFPHTLPHACGTGFNVGVTAGADAAAGAVIGPVGTVGVGAGAAFGGNHPNLYATASGGAAVWKKGLPAQQNGSAIAVGLGAGASAGVTFGNATEASQLSGPALTFGAGVDVGVGGGAQVSLGTDAAGNTIWQVSVVGGVGLKAYGYALTTNTAAAGTGTPCSKE